MKRIVSIFLSVLLILMLSGAASAEGELIKAEKDAVAWLMLYAGCAAQMQYGLPGGRT